MAPTSSGGIEPPSMSPSFPSSETPSMIRTPLKGGSHHQNPPQPSSPRSIAVHTRAKILEQTSAISNSPVSARLVQKYRNCSPRASFKRRRIEMINSSCDLSTNVTAHKVSTPSSPTGEAFHLRSKTSCRTRFRSSLSRVSRRWLASCPHSCPMLVGQPKRLTDYFETHKDTPNNNATHDYPLSVENDSNGFSSINIYCTKEITEKPSQSNHVSSNCKCTSKISCQYIHKNSPYEFNNKNLLPTNHQCHNLEPESLLGSSQQLRNTALEHRNSLLENCQPLLLSGRHRHFSSNSASNAKPSTKKSLRRTLTQTCINTIRHPVRSKTVRLRHVEQSYPLCTRWRTLDQDLVPPQVS